MQIFLSPESHVTREQTVVCGGKMNYKLILFSPGTTQVQFKLAVFVMNTCYLQMRNNCKVLSENCSATNSVCSHRHVSEGLEWFL